MSNIPEELKYTESHEWVRDNGDGTVTVGITEHAQELLGDLVFVELPELDAEFDKESESGVLESVKAASDLYCPIAGTITDANTELEDAPETINTDPYGDGWIFKLKPNSEADMDDLLDATAYTAFCAAEE